MFRVRKSSYFQYLNSILYCPSAKFNLGLLIFIDVAVLLYRTCVIFFIGSRTTIFYTTISLIKNVCMCLFVVAITIATALRS